MPRTTVFNVADAFLTIESMSHKKLQKLCYYTYSWYLALYNDRLFQNSFEAWIHGPVDPGLYQVYRGYGWQPIPQKTSEEVEIDPDVMEFVQSVFRSYGHLSGDQLEILTHREPPWLEARGGLPEYSPCNNPLNDDIIREYYLNEYQRAQND